MDDSPEPSSLNLPEGTVTFLFTDIEGSTKLLKRLGDKYVSLLDDHHRILREIFAKWHGREFGTEGDALFVTFPRATEAVAAVVEAQRVLTEHNWPEGTAVKVRMGLHTGEPWTGSAGYVGLDVHRAARIARIGHGGQVLLSETTAALVRDSLPEGVRLLDLGQHLLKDMAVPEHIRQLAIEGLPSDFPPLSSMPLEETSIEQTSTITEPTLQVSLLGEFALRQGETIIALDTPSYQALLACLIIETQHIHSRQQLAFQFWPDSSESQARTNLRKALHTLRKTLPDADCFLVSDRQTVQWRPDAPCTVDVWDFESAVVRAQQIDDLIDQRTNLEQAVAAYHGELLPGHYDDWVLSTRETYRQQYQAALEELLQLYENQRQYPEAITLARKLLREDPLHEAAYRRLICLQSLGGNVAGALRTYHACSTRLQRDLGVDPSPATREMYERLLNAKAPIEAPAPARLPLVARKQAWLTLQDAFQQCRQGQPGVVLLTGEAGIGKTRLAEELLDWTERQGIVALTADCYPSEQQLAYAPVAKWLRSENLQPIFNRLDRHLLVECSRLLPELLNDHPGLPVPGPLSESWQRQHLFRALAQTLLQLRQPMLLFVDDLQWCDQDTLDWLQFLVHYEPHSRLLLVGAARSEEVTPDHVLNPWRQQLEREGRLAGIELGRLDAGDSAQLAENVLKETLDGQQSAALFSETEGNPLFVVEMARAGLSTQEASSESVGLPPKAQAVIETRLASLSPPAYQLAQLASVIGRSFAFDILNQACGQREDSIIRGLDELWQRRIIRERGVDAYDFSHDKIRLVAYDALSQAHRRQFHRQVWRALETLYADDLDPVSGLIAGHCEAAGHYREAIVYYKRAAQVAQAIYANQDTLDHLQQALDLLYQTKIDPEQQAEILEQKGNVLTIIGHYEEAEEALATATVLTTDPWDLSRLYQAIASTHELQRHFDQAHNSLNAADEALQRTSKEPPETWRHEWLNIRLKRLDLYYFTGQIEEMIPLGEDIRPIVEQYGSAEQQAYYYRFLTRSGFRQEHYVLSDETVAYAQAAYDAAKSTDDIELLANSRFALAFANLWFGWHGRLENAEHHLKGTLELAERSGNVLIQARCLNYLVLLYRRQGDQKRVSELFPKAMLAAQEGSLQEYIAGTEANIAWLKWKEGHHTAAKAHGQKALNIWQSLPIITPFQWTALWPLVDISLTQGNLAEAIGYAQSLLQPERATLPEQIKSSLRQAIDAHEYDEHETSYSSLQNSLYFARELGQL